MEPSSYSPSAFVRRCESGLKGQLQCEGRAKFNDGAYVIPPPAGAEFKLLLETLKRSFQDGTFCAKSLDGIKLRVTEKTFKNEVNKAVLSPLKKKGFVENCDIEIIEKL